ncbi:hypothetical protein AArcSl_3190 [Halalkaliarchaeum desulfuricum]|uniref:UPF0215 protein AArcSl_3190 n=1 Tax=Halalkaliarchaeum desulfuricum TaxID=2055893 RepID=A0A343TNX4_9EURY|nr:DUF99 family protein [Halalkaliarchaeum desulfuricum]AUX10796.1 hypothetical protein AArcSl_3190 [Halalkaliarchaeum desulfuricum]
MKPGARLLGIATSDAAERSYLAGALVRVDRVVDGFSLASCTVGGLEATESVLSLFDRLDREDCRAVLLSGIAPAWFNLYDLHRIHDGVDRPVLSISFESSPGLEPALREHFSGAALEERLQIYRTLPPRRAVDVGEGRLYVRAVGCSEDRADEIVRAATPDERDNRDESEGVVPEPIRVAQLAAGAVRVAAEVDARGGENGIDC